MLMAIGIYLESSHLQNGSMEDCGIKVSTEETTYITWFRKAYYNGHQELAPRDYEVGVENLHNKKIDDMVERWFSIIDSQE